MKYENLIEVSESINTFNDAKFLSLLDSKTALVENTKTGDVYSVPFSNEDGISFDMSSAEIVEENIEQEETESPEKSDLKAFAKSLLKAKLDENEEAYQEGLEYATTLRLKETIQESKTNISESSEEIYIPEGYLREELDSEQKSFADSFYEKWSEKLETVSESFRNFISFGNLFENNSTVRDPREIIEFYSQKLEEKENFFAFGENLIAWTNELKEQIGESFKVDYFKSVNPLDENWKSSLTKSLVRFKKEYDDSVAIAPIMTAMAEKHREVFSESDMQVSLGLGTEKVPGSFDGEQKLNFLKMSGTFTQTDLGKLLEDFDFVLSQWPHLEESDFHLMTGLRNKIDYMYRTCMIDDETVASTINTFNTRFGKDGRDRFNDPSLTAGHNVSVGEKY